MSTTQDDAAVPADAEPGTAERPPTEAERALIAGEQAYLLNSRGLSHSETFSRVAAFLTALGAATVTLGLIAGQTGFSDAFLGVALVLLVVVTFLGWTCFTRLLQLNIEDIRAVLALNRIRHAQLSWAPGLESYVSGSTHDDIPGLVVTLGFGTPEMVGGRLLLLQGMVTSAATIGTITSVLVSLIAADTLLLAHADSIVVALFAVAVFVLTFLWHVRVQSNSWERVRRTWRPRFPSADEA